MGMYKYLLLFCRITTITRNAGKPNVVPLICDDPDETAITAGQNPEIVKALDKMRLKWKDDEVEVCIHMR